MAVKKEKFIELPMNGELILMNTEMIQCVKSMGQDVCQVTIGNSVMRVNKTYKEIKDILLGKTLTE